MTNFYAVSFIGLRYEYNVASSRVAAVREQCERLEDEIKVAAKIERGRARNTMRMSTGRSVARWESSNLTVLVVMFYIQAKPGWWSPGICT